MSELSFSILDNNADFIRKATQMRGAIGELGTEFTAMSTVMTACTEKMKEFINVLKMQMDNTIEALNKIKLENLSQIGSLQSGKKSLVVPKIIFIVLL